MADVRVRRSDRATFQKMEGGEGGVVLHLDSGAYHHVNEVGALIWELLEGGATRNSLVAQVRSRVEDPPDDLEPDVHAFLTALEERELVVAE